MLHMNQRKSDMTKRRSFECIVCSKFLKGIHNLKHHVKNVKSSEHILFRKKKQFWNIQLECLKKDRTSNFLLTRKVTKLIYIFIGFQ